MVGQVKLISEQRKPVPWLGELMDMNNSSVSVGQSVLDRHLSDRLGFLDFRSLKSTIAGHQNSPHQSRFDATKFARKAIQTEFSQQ